MADVLSEFLVSIKYQVDAAAENNFLAGLKRAALSVGGVAAELVALSGAVLGFSKILAEASGKMSWMSQRIGSSAGDITATANAMSLLGVSTEQANASLEGLHRFTVENGLAATAWLRQWGITAKDATGQYEQLAAVLARTAKDPNSRAMALQMARSIIPGLSLQEFEKMASGEASRAIGEQRSVQMHLWGVKTPQELKQHTDASSKAGLEVMNLFQKLGFYFEGFREQLGHELFHELKPELENLLKLLHDNTPTIKEFIKHFAEFMVAVVKGTVAAARGLNELYHAFEKLDPTSKMLIEVAGGLVLAFSKFGRALLASPVVWFIGALTTLLLLINDYQVWKEGGKSHFQWDQFDRFKTGFDAMAESMLGVKNGFAWMLAGFVALIAFGPMILRMAGFMGRLAGGVAAVARTSALAASGFGLMRLGILSLPLFLKGDTGPVSPEDKAKGDERRRQEAEDYKKKYGDKTPAERNKELGYTGDFFHDLGVWLKGGARRLEYGPEGVRKEGGTADADLDKDKAEANKKAAEEFQAKVDAAIAAANQASAAAGLDPAETAQAAKDAADAAKAVTQSAKDAQLLGRELTGDMKVAGDMTVAGNLTIKGEGAGGAGGGGGGSGGGGGGSGGGGTQVAGTGAGGGGGKGGITSPAGTPVAKTGLATVTTANGRTFQVDARFARNFQGFINDYEKAGGVIGPDSNTLGTRPNASGHPGGDAIDINQIGRGIRSRRGVSLNPELEDALAKKWGFVSGNQWRSNDQGHFGIESVEAALHALGGGGGGSTGERNFNPLNLRGAGGGFRRFNSWAEGVVAAVRQLQINTEKWGRRTLAEQITRWAPPNENDTKGYIARVAKEMGIDPNAALDTRDPETLTRLVNAMAHREIHGQVPMDEIRKGVALATGSAPGAGYKTLTKEQLEGPTLLPGGASKDLAPRNGAQPGGKGPVTIHQTTTVQVAPGPNATSTAHAVAAAQGRVNQTYTRGVVDHLR